MASENETCAACIHCSMLTSQVKPADMISTVSTGSRQMQIPQYHIIQISTQRCKCTNLRITKLLQCFYNSERKCSRKLSFRILTTALTLPDSLLLPIVKVQQQRNKTDTAV